MPRALKSDDADETTEDIGSVSGLIERGQSILEEVRSHPGEHAAWLAVPAVLGILRLLMMARAQPSDRTIHFEFAFRPSTKIELSLFRPRSRLAGWLRA